MPRVKRGTKRRQKRKKILDRASGYFLTKSKLYRSAKEVGRTRAEVCLFRTQAAQAAVPLAVDRAHRRRRQAERHELQPVHPRAEGGGGRTGPQDSGGPGGERSGRICEPGRAGQRRAGVGASAFSRQLSVRSWRSMAWWAPSFSKLVILSAFWREGSLHSRRTA